MDNRRRLGEVVGMSEELLLKICSVSMRAHRASVAFRVDEPDSSHIILAFSGSLSLDDWFARGMTLNDVEELRFKQAFPSLKSISKDEWSHVNPAFLRRFLRLLDTRQVQEQVQRAKDKKKKIVFAGHSLGGAIAIFATIWLLEQSKLEDQKDLIPLCLTFGAPLVGDKILWHALQREKWSCHFFHFISRYDIVPRISLSTLSSNELNTVLQLLDPNFPQSGPNSVANSQKKLMFEIVMRNALSIASHNACLAMQCPNLLLEAITSIVELSPYRPFGTYIFFAGNGMLVLVKNSEAILQMLFYCLQLGPGQQIAEVARTSFAAHLYYEQEVQDILEMQDMVCLDNLEDIPLSVEAGGGDVMGSINMALRELGLVSMEARLGLRASGELEKQKLRNLDKIISNCQKMDELHQQIEAYQESCRRRGVNYYEAFKLHTNNADFHANVARLDLAGIWDEISEMVKRYELPDDFEAQNRWIELGTRYRHLVEPLDIANFYRHGKNADSGPYMKDGTRPKRYRYTQRWLEWGNRMAAGAAYESCIWAEAEEALIQAEEARRQAAAG